MSENEEYEAEPMGALDELTPEEREAMEHPGGHQHGGQQQGNQPDQQEFSEVFFSFMREQTGAMMELRRMLIETVKVIGGQNEEGNLLDSLDALGESVDALQGTVGASNYFLSRVNFVLDRLVEIKTGDTQADPQVEGRTPTLDDVADAAFEFDEEVEAREKEEEKGDQEESGGDTPATKPSPFTQMKQPPENPGSRAYPPPPKAPSRSDSAGNP